MARNLVTGNARVGRQADVIHGGLTLGFNFTDDPDDDAHDTSRDRSGRDIPVQSGARNVASGNDRAGVQAGHIGRRADR